MRVICRHERVTSPPPKKKERTKLKEMWESGSDVTSNSFIIKLFYNMTVRCVRVEVRCTCFRVPLTLEIQNLEK